MPQIQDIHIHILPETVVRLGQSTGLMVNMQPYPSNFMHGHWLSDIHTLIVQWNLYIMDTLGPTKSVLIIKVSRFSRSVYMIKHHMGP